jgi:hypothetical protein
MVEIYSEAGTYISTSNQVSPRQDNKFMLELAKLEQLLVVVIGGF